MKVRETFRALLGGCTVYLLMAACAGTDGASSSSASASGQGGDDGGIWDALTNPVGDARAGEPDVATEKCDKKYDLNGTAAVYAEHSYPGRSVNDLANVRAVTHLVDSGGQPPGYQHSVATPWVAEGRAAVLCGFAANQDVDTVTFILPSS